MKTRLQLTLLIGICGTVATGCSQPFWSRKPDAVDPFAAAVQGRDLAPQPAADKGFLDSINPFRKDTEPDYAAMSAGRGSHDMPLTNSKLSPQQDFEQQLALARVIERKDAEYTRALNMYLDLEKKHPQEPRIQHRLGIMYAREANFPEAERRLQKAMQLGLEDAEIFTDIGHLYYLQGRYADALQAYDRALQIDVRHERAIVNMGLVLGEMGKFDEALEVFMRTLNRSEAWANLAYVYSQLGDLEMSRDAYAKSLSFDPKNRAAAEAILQIDASQKFVEKKRKLFEENKIQGRLTPEDVQANPFPQHDGSTQMPTAQDPIASARPLGAPNPQNRQLPPPTAVANYPESSQPAVSYNNPPTQTPPPLSAVANEAASISTPASSPAVQVRSTYNMQQPIPFPAPFGTAAATFSATDAPKQRRATLPEPYLDDISDAPEPAAAVVQQVPAIGDTEAATLPSPAATVSSQDSLDAQSGDAMQWRRPRIPGQTPSQGADAVVATREPVYKQPANNKPAEVATASTSTQTQSTKPQESTASSNLVEVVDMPAGQRPSSYGAMANGNVAGNMNREGHLVAQPGATSAVGRGNPVPVYYGPSREETAATTLPTRDKYADLKRQATESQARQQQTPAQTPAQSPADQMLTQGSAVAANNPPANSSRQSPPPLGSGDQVFSGDQPAQYQQTAANIYSQAGSDASQASPNSAQLPPVLTPSEYYARQLAHQATAANEAAKPVSPVYQPSLPSSPQQHAYQAQNPYGTLSPSGAAAAAETTQPTTQPAAQQADSRGILPNLHLPSVPSWLRR